MKKETLIIHTDTWSILQNLTNDQLGVLFAGLMKHQRDENVPKMDNVTKMAFDFMAAQVDRDNEKYEAAIERRRAAGRAGAAARWQGHTNGCERIRANAINGHTDTDTVTDTDTDTERYVSLAALPPLSPKDEAELRQIVGDRADALIEDVRAYYSTHTGFPGWPIALAQFDRNQKRWGLAKAQTAKSTADIMKMAFPEGVEQ